MAVVLPFRELGETFDVTAAEEAPAFPQPPPQHALVDATAHETAVLPRNFSLTSDERARALVGGLPAFIRRRRRLEDLEDVLLAAIAAVDDSDDPALETEAQGIDRRLALLNRLIEEHNRYYPIEANLPVEVTTGAYLDLGEPWKPLAPVTLDSLRERARARPRAPSATPVPPSR